MTLAELREMEFAKRLPAWTRLAIRERDGMRALTPHEVCVIKDVFDYIDAVCTDSLRDDAEKVALVLGFVEDVE